MVWFLSSAEDEIFFNNLSIITAINNYSLTIIANPKVNNTKNEACHATEKKQNAKKKKCS